MGNENRLYSISLGVASLQGGLVGVATALSPATCRPFQVFSPSFFVGLELGTGLLIERWRIHRHPYEFDQLSGTYIDRQYPSLRFCTKCLGPPDWLATHVTEKPDSYVSRRCGKVYMKEPEQPPNT